MQVCSIDSVLLLTGFKVCSIDSIRSFASLLFYSGGEFGKKGIVELLKERDHCKGNMEGYQV